MQPMWLCILSGRPFEETFENAQWRKAKQMQPMWLCLFSGMRFDETSENTQWRKAKQMQPMWLCMLRFKCIEVAFKNAKTFKNKRQWTSAISVNMLSLVRTSLGYILKHINPKGKQMRPMQLHIFSGRYIWQHTVEESQSNVTNAHSRQAFQTLN